MMESQWPHLVCSYNLVGILSCIPVVTMGTHIYSPIDQNYEGGCGLFSGLVCSRCPKDAAE